MTTVLNRDSIKVKRDLQKRIEEYVAQYCEALEENFKQYSINSFKRNLDEQRFPENNSYYKEELEVNLWNKLEDYLTVKLKSLEYCNNRYFLDTVN